MSKRKKSKKISSFKLNLNPCAALINSENVSNGASSFISYDDNFKKSGKFLKNEENNPSFAFDALTSVPLYNIVKSSFDGFCNKILVLFILMNFKTVDIKK